LFKPFFDRLAQANPATLLIGVWGRDGLELEKCLYGTTPGNEELVGAEMADVLSRLDSSSLAAGPSRFDYRSGEFRVLAISLNPQFFLVVLGGPSLIPGKVALAVELGREELLGAL